MPIERFYFVTFILILLILIVKFTLPLFYPFLIAFIIAYLIDPFVHFFQQKTKMPRWFSVFFILMFFISIMITGISILIAKIVIEIKNLSKVIPSYLSQLAEFSQQLISEDIMLHVTYQMKSIIYQLNPGFQGNFEKYLTDGMSELVNGLGNLVEHALGSIASLLTAIPNAATFIVISVLASFFISKDLTKIKKGTKKLLPMKARMSVGAVVQDLQYALFGFLKAQLTLISITAVIMMIGLLILGVKYAVTIGLLTGLVDLLPYLGTGAIFIPWIAYSFFTGNYALVIGLSALYGVIVMIRQMIEPKILSSNVGLDPLITLISLFAGMKLFGFIGLIIGPALVVTITALHRAHVFHDLWHYIKYGTYGR
ncbi:sporulation integral membrane protein YtvI [Microaerobacter geothermalis]|nr:sporulation integral membrane protein YtvI [Microaerobacter geothermalis]